MAQFSLKKHAGLILMALTIAAGSGRAQAPCTDEQARQWPGTLTLDRAEQADRDRRFRGKLDPVVLKKIDQAVLLLKQALPDLKGIGGKYSHEIADPGPHITRFWITAPFFDYYCVPTTKDYPPDIAGKVRLSDETGTWIYIYFNTLGWLVNEDVSLGKDMRTPGGEVIFRLPRENGEWKGHRVFVPEIHGESSEAIILTPPGHFPFKPVTRDEFIAAREGLEQKYIDEVVARVGPNALAVAIRKGNIEALRKFRDSMTAEELEQQAIVRNWADDPARAKIFLTEAGHGQRLVSIDQTYIDKSLPKSAVQVIVPYWRWNEDIPVKREMMLEFKRNLDVAALEKLIDR